MYPTLYANLYKKAWILIYFYTKSIETVNYCQEYFDFSLPSVLWAKRVAKFEVSFECSFVSLLQLFDFVCIAYCLLSTMFAWWIKILTRKINYQGRPTYVGRLLFYLLSICLSLFQAFFFDTQTNLPDSQKSRRQKYTRGSIVGQTRKIHSNILPIPPLFFTGESKSTKFGLYWPLKRSNFERKRHTLNLKCALESAVTVVTNTDIYQYIGPPTLKIRH